jgi:hypothetical protein
MNLPTFINKWIIGFSPIKYSPFWYWFRLINHSDFRMDDNVRNRDFWLNLNEGWEDMQSEYRMSQPGFDPYNLRGRDSYYSYVMTKND